MDTRNDAIIYLDVRSVSIINQGDSKSELIIHFGTKFELSVDHIQLLKRSWDKPYVTVINCLWNS